MRALVWLGLVLALAWPGGAAQAQFMDCKGGAFLQPVHDYMPKFACVEISRGTAAGRPVRFLWDGTDQTFGASLSSALPAIPVARAAMDDALPKWQAVTPLQTAAVTIILGSSVKPIESGFGKGFRGVQISPIEATTDARECIVMLDMQAILASSGVMSVERDLAFVVTHEFAHCVQRWNFGDRMYGEKNGWWVEGIASVLASVAVPDSTIQFDHSTGFLEKIKTTSLMDMDYEDVLFWQWVWNTSPAQVFDFMRALPKGAGGTAEQRARALRQVIGEPSKFAEFAQKLVDNEIPNVAGGHPGPLKPGDEITVTGTTNVVLPGPPFSVQYRPVVFRQGQYLSQLTGNPMASAKGVKAAGEDGWERDFPMQVGSNVCDEESRFAAVSMRLSKDDDEAAVDARKTGECGKKFAFDGPKVVDACLVGTWRVDNEARGGLLASWLDKGGRVMGTGGKLLFTFEDDNTALVQAEGFSADIATPKGDRGPATSVHVAGTGADSGEWSAKDGTLQYRAAGGTLSLDIGVTVEGMSFSVPMTSVLGDGNWTYTCTPAVVEMSYAGPVPVPAERTPRFTLRKE